MFLLCILLSHILLSVHQPCPAFRLVCIVLICSTFYQQSAVIKENATNSRNADGEWKLTPEKFMKVVRKILVTKSEDDLNLLQNVSILFVKSCIYLCIV